MQRDEPLYTDGSLHTIGGEPHSVPSLDLQSGSILSGFSPFCPLCSLGNGSFGEAVLAYHPDRPWHRVVLKIPRGENGLQAAVASQLLRTEAEVLHTLRHPGIVQCLGYVENLDCNFIVMTYVPGGSLADKLRSLPDFRLPAPKVARLLLDILQALEYVHSKGVLHLDVK